MADHNIGIVVAAHSDLAFALVRATSEILGNVQDIIALELSPQKENPHATFKTALSQFSAHDGVLILTDLFGGTPANIALSLKADVPIEIVTGVNLPMLLRALLKRSQMSVDELGLEVTEYARQQIMMPNALLTGTNV